MKQGPSVVVFGNCQARPLAETIRAIFNVEIKATIIVHLARQQDEASHEDALAEADVILAQQVTEAYPTSFVRTDVLKERFGAKVAVWQNLYFAGYYPDLVYCKRKGKVKGRLGGPLGEYHLQSLISAYREGIGLAAAVERMTDIDWHGEMFRNVPEESLKELQHREQRGGVPVSDLIAEQWTKRLLFYTFNHPSSSLLVNYALRLGRALDWKPVRQISPQLFGEPLGSLMLPINPYIRKEYELAFATYTSYRGARVKSVDNGAPFSLSPAVYYSAAELAESFWRVYDAQPGDLV